MTLRISVESSFDAVDEREWSALHGASAAATAFQSRDWLVPWWSVFGAPDRLRLLVARDDGRLLGLAPLHVHPTGRRPEEWRFVGDGHGDYQNFLVPRERPDVLDALLDALTARRTRTVFADVRDDTPLAAALRRHGLAAGFLAEEGVACPRVRFADRGPDTLLRKESVRRHVAHWRKLGGVTTRHVDAAAALEVLPTFFRLHVERWALKGERSLFQDPANRRFYEALAGAMRPGGPVVFTVVEWRDRPVAMHLGFRSEGELVWYKPVFDVRHARESPGEVLLAELIRYAAAESLRGIDFTRGDEAFKLRFASDVRRCRTWTLCARPATAQGTALARAVRGGVVRGAQRMGLAEPLRTLRSTARLALQGRGAELVATAREWLEDRRRRHGPVEVYVAHGGGGTRTETARIEYRTARTVAELLGTIDVADDHYAGLLRTAQARLTRGDRCHLGLRDGIVLASGWSTVRSPHPVTETGMGLEFERGTAVLYDFRVVPPARGQGSYTALLTAIREGARADTRLVIYAATRNVASLRGIEAAGWRRLGRLMRGVARRTVGIGAAGLRIPGCTSRDEPGTDQGRR